MSNTQTAVSPHIGLPDAVCPSYMIYGAQAPAFVLNPQASAQDLLSWCAVESENLRHMAAVGQNEEVFAGDTLRTIGQLASRLHVLSGVLDHFATKLHKSSTGN